MKNCGFFLRPAITQLTKKITTLNIFTMSPCCNYIILREKKAMHLGLTIWSQFESSESARLRANDTGSWVERSERIMPSKLGREAISWSRTFLSVIGGSHNSGITSSLADVIHYGLTSSVISNIFQHKKSKKYRSCQVFLW